MAVLRFYKLVTSGVTIWKTQASLQSVLVEWIVFTLLFYEYDSIAAGRSCSLPIFIQAIIVTVKMVRW